MWLKTPPPLPPRRAIDKKFFFWKIRHCRQVNNFHGGQNLKIGKNPEKSGTKNRPFLTIFGQKLALGIPRLRWRGYKIARLQGGHFWGIFRKMSARRVTEISGRWHNSVQNPPKWRIYTSTRTILGVKMGVFWDTFSGKFPEFCTKFAKICQNLAIFFPFLCAFFHVSTRPLYGPYRGTRFWKFSKKKWRFLH